MEKFKMLKMEIISGGSSANELQKNVNNFFKTFKDEFISLSYGAGPHSKCVAIVYRIVE